MNYTTTGLFIANLHFSDFGSARFAFHVNPNNFLAKNILKSNKSFDSPKEKKKILPQNVHSSVYCDLHQKKRIAQEKR